MIRLTAVIAAEGMAPKAVTHESNARSILIGRDGEAEFRLPLSTVSRRHARILADNNVYLVEDLGSTHGTLLNDTKLKKGEKRVLRSGDVIQIREARITCTIETDKLMAVDPSEGTEAIAARAVQGILGRLGEVKGEQPYLLVLDGKHEGTRLTLGGNQEEWVIGRSKDCDFVLSDRNVSRRHGAVRKDWSGITVQDMGSKNGVLVNGKRITRPRVLRDKDEITLGPVKLVFVDPDAPLLEALKDVPGFEVDAPSNEDPDAEDMAAPGVLSAGAEASDAEPQAKPAVPSPHGADDGGAEAAEELAQIDPSLLQDDGRSMQWVILPVVGLAILVVAALLAIILGA